MHGIARIFLISVLIFSLSSNPIIFQKADQKFDSILSLNVLQTNVEVAFAQSEDDEDDDEDELEEDTDEAEDEAEEEIEEETEEEEEIEIEVEIEDGIVKVKVEFDDQKFEFKLDATERDVIIEEIVARTGLTKEQVEAAIEIEEEIEEEEHEEREELTVKATTLEDMSIVEVELEFSKKLDESMMMDMLLDRENMAERLQPAMEKLKDDIVNEIAQRFPLDRHTADSLLEIEEGEGEEDQIEKHLKAEVETNNGFAEVEVELEYTIDTTDREEILDSIVEMTKLSAEEIKDALEFEMFSDKHMSKMKEKMAERQATMAKKVEEREMKAMKKSEEIIQRLEQRIEQLEQRLQSLLSKLETGEYFGP
ncbi:MAG: hypothetical protein ACREAG_00660, partial [Nitrosopumilaceae archaeon]